MLKTPLCRFCIFLWPPLVNHAPSGIVLKVPFFSSCTRLMKKLSLIFRLMTCLRDIDLHGRQLGTVQGQMC